MKEWVGQRIEIPSSPSGKMVVTQASYGSDGTVRLEGYVLAYVVVRPDGSMERRS